MPRDRDVTRSKPHPTPQRIGFFGGTFDPPHVGHVAVASDVADALELDQVLWVPAGRPPHKARRDLTPAVVRLDMVRAATHDDPRFVASALEIQREGPSYTVDSLRSIRDDHPEAELFLILGADQFRSFATWRDPHVILDMATLAVMDRDGADAAADPPPVLGVERARFVPVRRVDLSSTEVRRRIACGLDIAGVVPPGVATLIRRQGLYQG